MSESDLGDVFVIATNNPYKIEEISQILKPFHICCFSQKDVQVSCKAEETGHTFEENAYLKASAVSKLCGKPVISDDSGLCVDALRGAPGVYSARYAGENGSDEECVDKLLSEMEGEKDRTARFVCAICLYYPDGKYKFFTGMCEGKITRERRGTNGFGYDPVFLVERFGKTMAEMQENEKNENSHRGAALQKLAEYLKHLREEK